MTADRTAGSAAVCKAILKQSHWLLRVAKNCEWAEENLATVKLDSSDASRGRESRIELRNLQIKRKRWKSTISFCHQSSHVGVKLERCFEYCTSWKNTLGKFAIAVKLDFSRSSCSQIYRISFIAAVRKIELAKIATDCTNPSFLA